MNEQFKVGTICIGQNFVHSPEYNGMECEIIGALEMCSWVNSKMGINGVSPCYEVRWANGNECPMTPYHLRRKPPKQSDKEWADEAIRKLKKQSSDHVVIGKPELIPEETAA